VSWIVPQAAILISHLLRRIPTPGLRVSIAKRVAEIAEPLWFGVECVRWLRTSDGPEEEDSNTLTADAMTDVRRTLVERIKARAANREAVIPKKANGAKSSQAAGIRR